MRMHRNTLLYYTLLSLYVSSIATISPFFLPVLYPPLRARAALHKLLH